MIAFERVKETAQAAAALARRFAELQADTLAFLLYNTAQNIAYTPATKTFTAANATEIFTATAHGLLNGQKARVTNSGGALPAGLSAGVDYFLIGVTANTFQLSLSVGGAAVPITTDGTGTHTLNPVPDYITEEAGTGNLFGLPYDRTQVSNAIGSLSTISGTITGSHLSNLNLLAS